MKQKFKIYNFIDWLKLILTVIFPAVIFQGCTEEIDIELDSTYDRLVVWGEVTTDTVTHTVRLTKTADYFFNHPTEAVSDATVTISDGKNEIILEENDQEKGTYETPPDYYGIPGNYYTLNISNVDIDEDGIKENYTARSELRKINEIDSIDLEFNEQWEMWEIKVFAWDSPRKDWYLFKVYVNDLLVSDTLTEWFAQNDDLFNGNYTNGITSQFLDPEYEDERPEIGDTVTFEIDGITEGFYNFVTGMQQEIMFSVPLFSGPPANVTTNLDNGAVGYFAVYSTERSSTIVTETPY